MPNLVPYDKFRPRNIEKAIEYIRALARIDPGRLKYADEKSLKGRDICNKLARRDPFTGIIPPTMTDPDFRNSYSIIGICGISRRSTPVKYRITESTVDADGDGKKKKGRGGLTCVQGVIQVHQIIIFIL